MYLRINAYVCMTDILLNNSVKIRANLYLFIQQIEEVSGNWQHWRCTLSFALDSDTLRLKAPAKPTSLNTNINTRMYHIGMCNIARWQACVLVRVVK